MLTFFRVRFKHDTIDKKNIPGYFSLTKGDKMFESTALTPDMAIDISQGDFQHIHNDAARARQLVRDGMDNATIEDLEGVLVALQTGQDLSDAETGSDLAFAPEYRSEIKLVSEELERRSKR